MNNETNNTMTTIISKVNATGLKVIMNNQVTVVYLYSDNEGEYFMNENLEKQYVSNTPKEEAETIEENVKVEKEEKQDFTFEVEYQHNGRANGFALKTTTVSAYSYDEAIEKVKNRFVVIYEIAEA